MKAIAIFVLGCALVLACAGQSAPTTRQIPASKPAPQQSAGAITLESILNKMDEIAKNFKNAQADFVWDQYEKVVDSHDKQSGTISFRRSGHKLEMGAEI